MALTTPEPQWGKEGLYYQLLPLLNLSTMERRMGHLYEATCNGCGNHFEVARGGGHRFALVRCDLCGDTRHVGYEEIKEPRSKYLERNAAIEWDESHPDAQQIESEYCLAVEAVAGRCDCGGQFRLGAQARCPKCGSVDIVEGKVLREYL